jgi:hypothetical protein
LIEAGESFSFVEDLRDYSFINQSGAYVVQARIYPELFQANIVSQGSAVSQGNTVSQNTSQVSGNSQLVNIPLESNRLSLSVRQPLIAGPDGVPLPLDVETNAVLVRERLPPDEVVNYTLTARQKEQWEKFFLYLDLEAMLSRDSARRRQWITESEEGRQRMLDRYRRDLQSSVIDGDISMIPKDWIIERTAYGAEEGTVTVLEYFQVGTYTERKRYTYYLRRRDNVWTIVDYVVVNLGTE